ncbi:class I SAM-dependent methyltransferase [Candidatus Peregrinibacteria bacterium]|nr:class I SAM-dependent methyltransferase [Candidatus Peregrinibacteria bacterium]
MKIDNPLYFSCSGLDITMSATGEHAVTPDDVSTPHGDLEGFALTQVEQLGLYAYRVDTRGEIAEAFRLTGRDFRLIDLYSSLKFTASILTKVRENPSEKVRVLDLGGGVKSTCMRTLQNHPVLGKYVECINVDPFAMPQDGIQVVSEKFEDVTNNDVPAESIDVVMSFQVLDHMTPEHRKEAIEFTKRVLKKGGIALMDDDQDSMFLPWGMEPSEPFTQGDDTFTTTVLGEEMLAGGYHIMGSPIRLTQILKPKNFEFFSYRKFLEDPSFVEELKEAVNNY